MKEGPEWFAPKRFGYGSGLPISWQGWLVTTLFLGVTVGSVFLFTDKPLLIMAVVVISGIFMLCITAKTTRGGWKWRWGKQD